MANVLPKEKQVAVIAALAEGSSIRSIERMTGINRNTIMTLGVRIGQGCAALLDEKMRGLTCHLLQFDEIWGFIGKKQKHLKVDDDPTKGDVWTFCAIDAETKIVPAEIVWEGKVEVFDLHDHPTASRIYAWSHETDDPSNPRRHVAVLHLPPAITPLKAVQASIVSDYREAQANAEN